MASDNPNLSAYGNRRQDPDVAGRGRPTHHDPRIVDYYDAVASYMRAEITRSFRRGSATTSCPAMRTVEAARAATTKPVPDGRQLGRDGHRAGSDHREQGRDGWTQTRPLCPYPSVAKYIGSGSTDDANNFVCAAP